MNAIQLLGLVSSRHLQTYGIEPLLQAFMEDLYKLEQVFQSIPIYWIFVKCYKCIIMYKFILFYFS